MPSITFGDAYTEYSRIPALRETLEACAEGRLDEAHDLACTVKSELAERLAAAQDLHAVVLASQGLLDNALANAIRIFQIFPHLAIGYNRASELYMRIGQGLKAVEVYEAGLKAIKKDDMTQRTILQTHRNELKSQYRDLIRLLPFGITDHIFQEFDLAFALDSCAMVSKAWFQKVMHGRDISTLSVDPYNMYIRPVTAGRLLNYITTLEVRQVYMSWLESLFDEIEDGRVIDNIKTVRLHDQFRTTSGPDPQPDSQDIDSQNILAHGLTKLSRSLTSLSVRSIDIGISPLVFLASCPNLTRLEYIGWVSATSLEMMSTWTDKLTHLVITTIDAFDHHLCLSSEDLQYIMSATPNVRYASIAYISSGVFPLVQQHWSKLRSFYLNIQQTLPDESDIIEDEEYLHLYVDGGDIRELHAFLGEQKSRLRILEMTIGVDIDNGNFQQEFKSITFDKLDCLYVGKIRNEAGLLDFVNKLLLGAVKVKDLTLFGVTVHPETFEILKRMHQLEHLGLRLGYLRGVDTYLDHLAALGPESPLKSITFYDKGFDDHQRMLRVTRVTTLMHITILHTVLVRDDQGWDHDASWTLDFLRVLEQSKSMVERISIPHYAVTAEAIRLLSKLAALRHLELIHYEGSIPEFDFTELLERNPSIDIELTGSGTSNDYYFFRAS